MRFIDTQKSLQTLATQGKIFFEDVDIMSIS